MGIFAILRNWPKKLGKLSCADVCSLLVFFVLRVIEGQRLLWMVKKFITKPFSWTVLGCFTTRPECSPFQLEWWKFWKRWVLLEDVIICSGAVPIHSICVYSLNTYCVHNPVKSLHSRNAWITLIVEWLFSPHHLTVNSSRFNLTVALWED